MCIKATFKDNVFLLNFNNIFYMLLKLIYLDSDFLGWHLKEND